MVSGIIVAVALFLLPVSFVVVVFALEEWHAIGRENEQLWRDLREERTALRALEREHKLAMALLGRRREIQLEPSEN